MGVFPHPAAAAARAQAVPAFGGAVFYMEACKAVPELNREEQTALSLRPEAFKPELARRAVERYGPSLDLLVKGAKEPACGWPGGDLNEGDFGVLPLMSQTMKPARALAARARLHLEAGRKRRWTICSWGCATAAI